MLPGSTIAEPGNIVTRLENFSNLVTSYQVTAYNREAELRVKNQNLKYFDSKRF